MTDNSIIQACANNDAAAQRELYNRYSGLFFGICYRYAFSREDAEDMLQEGFLRIFNGIKSFEYKGNFEGWMRRTIVNTCINILRKNQEFNALLQINEYTEIEFVEESIASKLLGRQAMQCLLQMPVRYRIIINLFAIEGYTYREIATLLDMEESTCRSRYMRGKEILENILRKKNLIPKTEEKISWLNLLNG